MFSACMEFVSRKRISWKWGFGILGVVGLLVILANVVFVRHGLLAPDFAVVRRSFQFHFTHLPALLGAIGLGSLVLAFVCAGTRNRRGWGLCAAIALTGAGGIVGLRYYVTQVEPRRLVLREVTLVSDKVTAPLRILHFTDLQSGGLGEYEERVFSLIASLEPDLVIHTGDWLQPVPPRTFEDEFRRLVVLLRRLDPALGFFGVYGDTDGQWYALDPREYAPMVMLGTRPFLIEWPGGKIALYGLSLFQSRYAEMAQRPVERWFSEVPEEAFTLLAGHAPDFAMSIQHLPIDLCLAGHTHGGQVRLPFYGALVTESDTPRHWARGYFAVGRTRINVSAGVGTVRAENLPPIRFNCPSELTLIQVLPSGGEIPDKQ